ncbi:Uncharacterised protein [Nocardia farcinica]|uniref:hypothetical protein n=1 Tax=Nocardia farcinica TaxID=37329 RepID=UPI000E01BD22|nr:hypothetical protein [Nocardia farcinica]SUE28841.1 Uncharacterised protein [Nocardia farcinica]
MSADDGEILEFARIWHPYGGPPAGEILIRFGIGPADFHRRVLKVMATPLGALLTRKETAEITRIATHFPN